MCINWKEGIQIGTQESSMCDLGETKFGALLLASLACKRFDRRASVQILSAKPHGCLEHVLWLESNVPPITNLAWRDPPMAMPDQRKGRCVEAYRKYYNGPKRDRGLLKYTKRHMPY